MTKEPLPKHHKGKYYRYLPMLVIMASIFFLSHMPGDHLPHTPGNLDKICHAIAYGTLTICCLFAVQPLFYKRSFLELAITCIGFALLFGVSDEFHQTFVANRSADWRDLIADVTGSAAAILIWYRWGNKIISMPFLRSLNTHS